MNSPFLWRKGWVSEQWDHILPTTPGETPGLWRTAAWKVDAFKNMSIKPKGLESKVTRGYFHVCSMEAISSPFIRERSVLEKFSSPPTLPMNQSNQINSIIFGSANICHGQSSCVFSDSLDVLKEFSMLRYFHTSPYITCSVGGLI